MATAVTIGTVTNPVLLADLTSASAAGTTDANTNVVTVTVTDELGTTVSHVAAVAALAWTAGPFDLSALVDGPLLWTATAVALDTTSAFAATVGEKGASLLSVAPSVVNAAWATHLDVSQDFAADGITALQMDQACVAASDILFLLTGGAWAGPGSDLIRPQARWVSLERNAWSRTLAGYPASGYGYCACNRDRETGCNRLPEIKLPHPHVDELSVVVKLDGAAYGAHSGVWRLDDSRWLVRIDGDGWPCCQDLTKADTEPHTWSVAYDWGVGPDVGGVMAAAALGYQLALARAPEGSAKCRLPKRITHITRGGTSIAVLDPLTLFKDGLTGITEVDLWIVSKMLGKQRRGATVSRPSVAARARRVGTV